jgi:serine/threonine-protein kinase
MEYVEGLDLRQLLGSCARRKLSPPVEIRLAIVCAILEALEAVHRARGADGARLGLIHRDISPSNVLLGFDGCIKLCDFGIAIAAGSHFVTPENIEGKAAYMSPEQARGEPFDRRVDIYAAGVLAWELLAGRRMRNAASREELLEVAAAGRVPPMPLRGLPNETELLGIVRTALSLDPQRRYPTATAMLRALEAYCERHGLRADRASLAAWLGEHFTEERALRPRAAMADEVEEPTASGVRRVRRAPTLKRASRSYAGLAVRALALGSAVVWLLHGLGAW